MKKNLPNDGLEKFLKNSFEGYEENPSNDVWDNINSGLKSDGVIGTAASSSAKSSKYWWLAAAAGLMLCIGFAQYFYFNSKIEKLTQKVDGQGVIITDLKEEQKNTGSLAPNSETENTDFSNTEILETEEKSFPNNKENSSQPNLKKVEKTSVVETRSEAPKGTLEQQQIRYFEDELPDQQIIEKDNSSYFGQKQEHQNGQSEIAGESNIENEIIPFPNNEISNKKIVDFSIEKLSPRVSSIEFKPNYQFVFPQINSVIPVRKLKKGITVAPFYGFYQSKEKVDFNDRMGPPPHGVPMHHDLDQEQTSFGTNQFFGLKCGLDLKNNWGLSLGLAYRLENFKSSLKIRTKFRDRHSSGGPNDHRFKYAINTSDGSAEIEVRADSAEPNEPINDNEELEVTLDVNRVATYISTPVEINYSQKIGNWSFGAGTGLLFNFPLNSNLEVDGSIKNNKFKHRPERKRKPLPKNKSSVLVDAIGNLKIGYQLSNSLELAVAPSVLVELRNDKSFDPRIKSVDKFSYGGELGLRYNF